MVQGESLRGAATLSSQRVVQENSMMLVKWVEWVTCFLSYPCYPLYQCHAE